VPARTIRLQLSRRSLYGRDATFSAKGFTGKRSLSKRNCPIAPTGQFTELRARPPGRGRGLGDRNGQLAAFTFISSRRRLPGSCCSAIERPLALVCMVFAQQLYRYGTST
jgi:hypothetical protein